jgi:primosomal protein N' (replication factor Y) (superfamily II helicase)
VYRYAGIIVNNEAIQVDRIFTYEIPDSLKEELKIGYRVKVPFGKGNSVVDGFVLSLYDEYDGDASRMKKIRAICDDFPVLRTSDILLIEYMRNKYLCSYIDGIRTIIPTGLTKGVKVKTSEVIFIGKELSKPYDKEKYSQIFKIVAANNGVYNRSELSRNFDISLSSINTLLKHGFLCMGEVAVDRYDRRIFRKYEEKTLNAEQEKAVAEVINGEDKTYLLHGVTGSGKTEIYMHLVSKMLQQGKEAIVLVPEISLTPQMVERFKGRFGRDIAVFHSKLSEGERYDEWLRIKRGKVKIAIGARSAIFLPFSNLGIIVIDEEHESSYKSESNPKYDARDIAQFKQANHHCKIILGSATPSVETYFKCHQKDIRLIEIRNRADNSLMPSVEIVDMREELANNNKSIFSRKLYHNIRGALLKREQIILFLNRRGFSTFVSCRKCGFVFKCGNCDISMTYHIDGDYLSCHYCGNKSRARNTCPKCGSNYVKYFGVGTEKIETEIKKLFPEARVIRMDFDTTRRKNSYEDIYNSFKEGLADILIGTQMVAKGLDFPNVTLVGVLAADLSLNLPDYKSSERTFQLLTQVSGRAGRGKKPGNVIIQTYSPEHYSITHSVEGDYRGFYDREISIRSDMYYPPFSKILCINLSSKNESLLIKNIQNIGIKLKDYIKNSDKIDMLGPCPCSISKIKEMYRWQILLKGDVELQLAQEVKFIIYDMLKEVYSDIKVSMDTNPNSLL